MYSYYLLILVLGFSQHHIIQSAIIPDCDISLSSTTQTVSDTDNITVLCQSTCTTSQLIWYDNNQKPVINSNRIFTINYGRGRYSRLIILNTIARDSGSYICVQDVNNKLLQKTFSLNNIDKKPIRRHEDRGPRRGDISILPRRLPVRRRRRGADMVSTMMSATYPDQRSSTDSSLVSDISSGNGANDNDNDMPGNGMSSSLDSNSMEDMTTYSTPPQTRSPVSTRPRPPQPTTMKTIQRTTMKVQPTPEPEPETKSEPEPETKSEPEPETKSEPEPETGSYPKTARPTRPVVKPQYVNPPSSKPNTQFGRVGLVAFVISLSIAILLLYALLMLLFIPIILKKRDKARIIKKRSTMNPKVPDTLEMGQTQVTAIPSPGSNKDGFETIDLDDTKVDDKPGKDEEVLVQSHAPVPTPKTMDNSPVTLLSFESKSESTAANNLVPGSDDQGNKLPTNDNSSSTPQVLNSAPEGSSSLPDGSSSTPEGSNSIPEGSSSTPEMSSSAPGGSSSALEDSNPKPEGPNSVPEGSSTSPEGSSTTPEGSSTTPEVVDEPNRKSSETTQVHLDIVEKKNGQKQIRLSSSGPQSPDITMISGQSSESLENL